MSLPLIVTTPGFVPSLHKAQVPIVEVNNNQLITAIGADLHHQVNKAQYPIVEVSNNQLNQFTFRT